MSIKTSAKWVDIKNPTPKDLERLQKEFRIHPIILEELRSPSARSRVELYKDYMYMIYYFPVYDEKEESSRRTELDFIITKNSVVTVRYEDITALEGIKIKNAGNSLNATYELIEHLLGYQERQLRHIGEKAEEIGRHIFKNQEKEVLKRVSRLKRDISEYRIVVNHQSPILKSLAGKGVKFWGENSLPYLNDLVGDHLKIVDQLDAYREAVSDFEDTNNQLMNLKINEVMITFTTLSFMTFPFMLLAAIFSMNTPGTPLSDTPGAFWMVFGAMAVSMVTLITYFKKRGWI